ncbi:MAG: hypothetical protein ACKVHI_12660 [Candidatus Puniceispirillales bacterium]
MNKQIGENMNNLKKIGLTALAGSLVAVSANAIEMSVSGTTSVSYTSKSASKESLVGGQAIGVDTGISFTGSGELENGFTVKTFAALDDGRANTLSSSQLTLGMGSLGTVVFAQQFGTAANGIDDVTPRVKEESWDQAGGSVLQGFGRATAEGAVTSGLAISFGVDYDPVANAASDDHDATTTKAGNGSGTGAVIKIASDLGLTVGAGIEQLSAEGISNTDTTNLTAYALYTMGPVSIGYQEYYLDQGSGNGNVDISAGGDYTGNAMGIAFNVNDNLSLSYGEINETLEAASGTLAADRDTTSFTAAYSAGGMAVTLQQTDTDNWAMNTTAANARDTETTQITLAFAF